VTSPLQLAAVFISGRMEGNQLAFMMAGLAADASRLTLMATAGAIRAFPCLSADVALHFWACWVFVA
jgi:hypothetical protein